MRKTNSSANGLPEGDSGLRAYNHQLRNYYLERAEQNRTVFVTNTAQDTMNNESAGIKA